MLERCFGPSIPFLILSIAALACSQSSEPIPVENVVLITMDTTRVDFLGAYGFPQLVSPHVDALARRGVVYEDAYSTAPFTGPAHASILTSQHPSKHGIIFNGHRVDGTIGDGSESLAEILARRGLSTGAVVSSGVLDPRYGFRRGFDFYRRIGISQDGDKGGKASLVTDAAIAWLQENASEPFFLWVHYIDPHLPYVIEEEIQEALGIQDRAVHGAWPHQISTERLRQAYRGEIFETDAEVGRLLDHFEQMGSTTRTLIVLTADHGEYLHEHGGMIDHSMLYEQVLHVPLIFAGPGVPENQRRHGLVSVIDIAPTIIQALGIEATPSHQGTSLWGFPTDTDPVSPVFAEWRHFNLVIEPGKVRENRDFLVSVQVGSTKVILPVLAPDRIALFNLAQDPNEGINLAQERSNLRSQLETLLHLHIKKDLPNGLQVADGVEFDEKDKEMLRALGYIE